MTQQEAEYKHLCRQTTARVKRIIERERKNSEYKTAKLFGGVVLRKKG
jgi:hypothetical protein